MPDHFLSDISAVVCRVLMRAMNSLSVSRRLEALAASRFSRSFSDRTIDLCDDLIASSVNVICSM